jgi:phosphatidylglycerophosphatase A
MKSKIDEMLFTGFFTGYSPLAPGTAGTLVALIIYLIIYYFVGTAVMWVNMVLVLLLAWPAMLLCEKGEKFFQKKDPGEVVLDEIVGFWLALFALPFNWVALFMAFILFRFFDIVKPFPIRQAQSLEGGLGVVLDDYIAGAYTVVILQLIYHLGGGFPTFSLFNGIF